jgi:hypothetical protein
MQEKPQITRKIRAIPPSKKPGKADQLGSAHIPLQKYHGGPVKPNERRARLILDKDSLFLMLVLTGVVKYEWSILIGSICYVTRVARFIVGVVVRNKPREFFSRT